MECFLRVLQRLWVDADACPVVIKEILFRAAKRTKTMLILVANQPLNTPASPFIKKVQVSSGFDVADNHIVQEMQSGELVVTADIPLAAEAMEKGGIALNPRGELYSHETIKQRLVMRDFNEELRSSGMMSKGPAKLSQRDINAFANSLDQFLARQKK